VSDANRGYRRTVIASLAMALAAAIPGVVAMRSLPGFAGSLVGGTLALIAMGLMLLATAGWVVLHRARADGLGRTDLYLAANATRAEQALADARNAPGMSINQRLRRRFAPRWIRVGDRVRIRSREEVFATLDASGRLDALPFMPEMQRHCGQLARVHRVVDKIYDYGRTKRLMRLRGTVSLAGLRCDGVAHGGCEAGCLMLWKREWLAPVSNEDIESASGRSDTGRPAPPTTRELPTTTAGSVSEEPRFVCQYTELSAASTRLSRRDPRLDLRPLLAGNVTLGAFAIVVLTRWFNRFQRLRSGVGYPAYPSGRCETTPSVDLGLRPGERIRVAAADDIARTLNRRNRNRGLWFDRDMIKHCGRDYRVLRRVNRIIDDASGRMLEMKTPCIVLSGVVASGEFHHFLAQEDHMYWREIWLRPLDRDGQVSVATAAEPRERAEARVS
jgi:hypothetical protein